MRFHYKLNSTHTEEFVTISDKKGFVANYEKHTYDYASEETTLIYLLIDLQINNYKT